MSYREPSNVYSRVTMRTNPIRKWVVTLALTAGGGTAFAGDRLVGSAPPIPAAPASILPIDADELPLTVSVLAPSGAYYRLAYTVGQGWRFVGRIPDEPSVASNGDVALSPTPTSSADQPQSVVVDGPTGYIFVWNSEHGWRFLGRIAETRR